MSLKIGGTNKKDGGDWGGPNWNDQRDPRDLRHNEMRQMMDSRESMRPGSMDHRYRVLFLINCFDMLDR